MSTYHRKLCSLAAAIAVGPAWALAQAQPAAAPAAQGPVIYPSKGQTPELQEKDKAECYAWAQKQTGYDPVAAAQARTAPPASAQGTGGGEAVRGAAKGAAAGAAVGAIAGDAGTGAAAGAAAGGVAGRGKKKQAAAQQQQQATQQQAAEAEKLAQYQKAFGVCMEGRGYAVK